MSWCTWTDGGAFATIVGTDPKARRNGPRICCSRARGWADIADGTLTASDETVAYTYDVFGRELTVTQTLTNHTRITENIYDSQGRLVTVKGEVDGDTTFEQQTNYEYDPVTEQQIRVWTGTNSASPTTDIQYVYDALGRLDQVEEHWRFGAQLDADAVADGYEPEVTDYVYDLSGNLAQTRFAGGVLTDYQYDVLNRLDLMRNYVDDGDNVYELAGDTLLSEFDYTVRADGKRTAVDETVYDGSSTETTRVDWLYDNIGRLIEEDYNSSDDTLDFTADYVFELVGNRREKSVDRGREGAVDEIFSYDYDANDRLLSETLNHQTDDTQDRHTVYGYDVTQQTSETVHVGLDATGATVEQTTYTYNLQGRMATAEVSQYDSSGQTLQSHTKSSYEYDDRGIRVAQTQQDDVNNDGDFDDAEDTTERTDYHGDDQNPTGYAQVLEEMQGAAVAKSYTIGHDVFLEAVAANQVRHLLRDGHGSTRQLVDATGAVINSGTARVFAYDAYGNPHGFSLADALTTHLYSGEQTDQLTGLQYLRARYYNPATGTFNRLDPFAGSLSDPLSLHKYLYCHADAVNGSDPTGMWLANAVGAIIGGLGAWAASRIFLGIAAEFTIRDAYLREVPTVISEVQVRSQQIGRKGDPDIGTWDNSFRLRPDILDKHLKTYYEIKSSWGVAAGERQLNKYQAALALRFPSEVYSRGDWVPRQGVYRLQAPAWLGELPLPISIRVAKVAPGLIVYSEWDLQKYALAAGAIGALAGFFAGPAVANFFTSGAGPEILTIAVEEAPRRIAAGLLGILLGRAAGDDYFS